MLILSGDTNKFIPINFSLGNVNIKSLRSAQKRAVGKEVRRSEKQLAYVKSKRLPERSGE